MTTSTSIMKKVLPRQVFVGLTVSVVLFWGLRYLSSQYGEWRIAQELSQVCYQDKSQVRNVTPVLGNG